MHRKLNPKIARLKRAKIAGFAIGYGLFLPQITLAGVPENIHQRCLEARDYFGCVKAMQRISEQNNNKYIGIGIRIFLDQDTANLTVHSLIKGAAAAKSGVRKGDVILFIDDKSTKGMGLKEATKLIKGKAGTQVRLVLQRTIKEEQKDTLEIKINREIVLIPKSYKHKRQIRQWTYKGLPDDLLPLFPENVYDQNEEPYTNMNIEI